MTEEPPAPTKEEKDSSDLIAQLRDDFAAQISELKQSTDALIEAQRKQIEQLEADKKGLQAALVKSATSAPPAEAPKPKTEEEIYNEKVEALAKKGLEDMKRRLTE